MCTCAERQEGEEKRWFVIRVCCTHRHDSHCAVEKKIVWVWYYTETKADMSSPAWGSFQSYEFPQIS